MPGPSGRAPDIAASTAGRGFLAGAAILLAGSLLSRLLGAVYHFVLPILMGGGALAAVGMGLFGMAYPLYNVLLSLSAVGVPLGVSKLVSEALAQGRPHEAIRTFRLAAGALALVGAAGSLLLYLFAQPAAMIVGGDPRAAIAIQAIAPAAFFVSLESAYRGFFQGLQHMTPHAASQVVEQVIRVVTMFVLVALLISRGIAYAAAGASFGAVTGAVAGLLFLALAFRRDRQARSVWRAAEPEPDARPAPASTILRRLLALVVPIALAGLILPLSNVIDAVIVPLRLHAAGFDTQHATELFGVLVGYAQPFMVAPTIVTTALAISLVPAVSQALARRDGEGARDRAAAGVRVTVLLTLPAAAGLFALAGPLPELLYHSAATARPLAVMAWGVLFLGLQQTTAGVLQGMDRAVAPVIHLAAGVAVTIAISWVLVASPAWNVTGAALATVAGFALASALNLWSLRRHLGSVLDAGTVVRAAVATAATWLAAEAGLRFGAHVGHAPAIGAAVACGAVAYVVVLGAIGGVRSADVESLPRVGPRLVRALRRLRLVRG